MDDVGFKALPLMQFGCPCLLLICPQGGDQTVHIIPTSFGKPADFRIGVWSLLRVSNTSGEPGSLF